jgi:large subunit ribosomal protein L24
MSKMFVRTGDTVRVISGKSKGVQGEVLAVSPKENKVIVKKVNVVTKHVKPRKMGEPGGLIDVESALYASKVQLVCPKCGEATRVGHKKGGIRICKKCGNEF